MRYLITRRAFYEHTFTSPQSVAILALGVDRKVLYVPTDVGKLQQIQMIISHSFLP